MNDVRVMHVTRAATFGICNNVGIWVWRRGADAAMIDQLGLTLDALAALECRSGIVTVVGRGVMLPSNAIRTQIVQACRKVTGHVVAGAVVHEQDDLMAALVRGVVTGLLVLGGSSIYPHSVFRSMCEACDWVRNRLDGEAPSTETLIAAIDEVRAVRAEDQEPPAV